MKNCVILLISLCCGASLVRDVAGRTPPPRITPSRAPPPREEPPTLSLVDSRPGFSPLYQGTNETLRLKGRYIIKLKETTEAAYDNEYNNLGRLLGKLSDQNKDAPSGTVRVQGSYSTVGLGVMAELTDDALEVVSSYACTLLMCMVCKRQSNSYY